jgi:hypothetical protein
LLGLGELGGFLILFIGSFGEGVNNGKNEIIVQNSTLLVIILCLLGLPTIFFTLAVCGLSFFHCFLVYKYYKLVKSSKRKNYKRKTWEEPIRRK